MNKSELKKDLILCRGLEVMQTQGYNGTSVKDIVDAAKVPKGSFYNYFDSKESFAVEVIDKAAKENFEAACKILRTTEQPPLQRLDTFFKTNADNACENEFKIGCFLGNMCQEMAANCETIRLKIKSVLGDTTRLIEEVLLEAQGLGQIEATLDTAIVAEFLFNAWEGALMRMKASKCKEPLDAFLAMLPLIYKT